MLLAVFLLFLGAFLLYFGANWLVVGASALAGNFGVAPAVVGLTVVAFGTSLPELVVTVTAAARGSSSMALGNVVGSNIANIALILGAASSIRALKVELTMLKREAPMGLVALGLVVLLTLDGVLSRIDGVLLLTAFLIFLWWSVTAERKMGDSEQQAFDSPVLFSRGKSLLMVAVGLGAVLGGGQALVEGGVMIATALGVSSVVIGLTILAVGTSLPELATSMMAVAKGEDDIGVGGVLGSNLFNLLLILGIAALLTPIEVPRTFFTFQYPILGAFTLGLLPMAASGGMIKRGEGVLLLVGYILYVAALYLYPVAG